MIFFILLIIGSLHTKYLLVHLQTYSDETDTNKPEKEVPLETNKARDYQHRTEEENAVDDYQYDNRLLSNTSHAHNII